MAKPRVGRFGPGSFRSSVLTPKSTVRLTTVLMPEGHSDAFRATVLDKFNMSLGNGLGILKDRVFRIGHLGDFNDLMLIGTLGGVEMGLALAGGVRSNRRRRHGGDGLSGCTLIGKKPRRSAMNPYKKSL